MPYRVRPGLDPHDAIYEIYGALFGFHGIDRLAFFLPPLTCSPRFGTGAHARLSCNAQRDVMTRPDPTASQEVVTT